VTSIEPGTVELPLAPPVWRLGDKLVDCSRPRVMAIVNATPDSFYAGSTLVYDAQQRRDALARLLAEEPDIIDIGGQSTRPGSARVSAAEELSRVLPVIQSVRELCASCPLTVDTYSSEVAREALSAGADGVNDISGGSMDPLLWEAVAESQCGYVLMHMQGTPETMQLEPRYEDVVSEVRSFLADGLSRLQAAGVAAERVVLDPGIGFGKRLEDNVALVRHAADLSSVGRPLLYGVSRKSFIARLGAGKAPEDRLPGTLAATWELLRQGVMLHRVHDVADVKQVFFVFEGLGGCP
jgi:dihydropteroate synthase